MAAKFTELEIRTMFSILDIDPTKDENAIRDAYRKRLPFTNPEDDPTAFMQLRGAYERALVYAKTEDEEPKAPAIYDDTPAGQWVHKADDIYRSFANRVNPECWEELFHDDYFQSLDGEQECIDRMLVFMTRHFYYPTAVWKVFDKYLGITANTAAIREKIPAPFVNMLVSKCRNGEQICFDYFKGPDNGEYDLFLSLLIQCEGSLYTGHPEEARRLMAELEERNVYHPAKKLVKANLLIHDGKVEEALDILKELKENYPADRIYRGNYARQCWEHGRKEEAAALYEEILKDEPNHYQAHLSLACWYYDAGDFKQAKKHAEKVLKTGGDDNFEELLHKINAALIPAYKEDYEKSGDTDAALDLGWCYLQDRRLMEGLRFVKSLEEKIPEKSRVVYHSLMAKLYYENVEYDACIEETKLWREELAKKIHADSDDAEEKREDEQRMRQTYLLTALALEAKGHNESRFYREALEEIEKYEGLYEKHDDLTYEKAEIYYSMGDYDRGLKTAEYLVEERQFFLGLTVKLKCCMRMGDAAGVVSSSRPLWHFYPTYAKGYEEVARVFRDFKRKQELDEVLAQAEKNGVKSIVLDACAYGVDKEYPSEAEIGRRWQEFVSTYFQPFEKNHDRKLYEEGLPVGISLFYDFPSTSVLNILALFHMEAGNLDEGEKLLIKVLETDPYDEGALNNMGLIYKFREKYDEAVICLKKALYFAKSQLPVNASRNLSGVYERMGEYRLAAEINDELRGKVLRSIRTAYSNQERIRLISEDRNALKDTARFEALDGRLDDALRIMDGYGRNTDLAMDRIAACVFAGQYAQAADEAARAAENILNTHYDVAMVRYKVHLEGIESALAYLDKIYPNLRNDAERLEAAEKKAFLLISMPGAENERKAAFAKMKELAGSVVNAEFGNVLVFSTRFLAWLDFLSAAASDDVSAMEAAFERMEAEPRCRNCRERMCVRLETAKAMLLEKKEETEKARTVYNKILEIMPYDLYAAVRLKGIEDK